MFLINYNTRSDLLFIIIQETFLIFLFNLIEIFQISDFYKIYIFSLMGNKPCSSKVKMWFFRDIWWQFIKVWWKHDFGTRNVHTVSSLKIRFFYHVIGRQKGAFELRGGRANFFFIRSSGVSFIMRYLIRNRWTPFHVTMIW